MLKNRIIAVTSIVIIVNLLLILRQWSDSPLDFIPFIDIFANKSLQFHAYDIFIAVTIVLFLRLYSKYGINLSAIKSIPCLFFPINALDVGVLVGAGVLTYFFVCPYLWQFFSDPILRLSKYSHDSIRHTVMVALIFGLLFIIAILSKSSSPGAYHSAPTSQPPNMPPPPTW
jgi:hypothetical protein